MLLQQEERVLDVVHDAMEQKYTRHEKDEFLIHHHQAFPSKKDSCNQSCVMFKLNITQKERTTQKNKKRELFQSSKCI
jgi:hypothetical protein